MLPLRLDSQVSELSRGYIKVFGSTFLLTDSTHVKPIVQRAEQGEAVGDGRGRGRGRGRGCGGGRGGERGGGHGDTGRTAAVEMPAKPAAPGVTELAKLARPWAKDALVIAIELRVSGGAKSSATSKRIVSLAAQLVHVDSRAGGSPSHFHAYVASDFAFAGDATSLKAEHGAAFVDAWAKAKDDFSSVGPRFIAWLSARGAPSAVVLASWGGLDRSTPTFAVLCAELRRHSIDLPWSVPISLLDVERELRLTLRTPQASLLDAAEAACIGTTVARRDAALAAAGVSRARAETSLALLRGQSSSLEGVRMLAGVLGDPAGLLIKRGDKVVVPLDTVWSWAGALATWEQFRRTQDQLPEGWQTAMPFEEAPSKLSKEPSAGPSAALRAHVGITARQPTVQLNLEELLLKLWLWFLKPEVAEHIADAINERADDNVVKEGNKLRRATGKDRRSSVRKRSPALVAAPVTAGEVYRLHAFWLWMGFYPRTRVEDYWSDVCASTFSESAVPSHPLSLSRSRFPTLKISQSHSPSSFPSPPLPPPHLAGVA